MSNGFMAEPIRPGENNSANHMPNNNGYASGRSSNNSAVIIVVVIIIIMFVAPFVGMLFFVKFIKDEFIDDFPFGYSLEVGGEGYGLNQDEQRRIARIWSTVNNDNSASTIVQGDCLALKNAVTGYANYNEKPVIWYDPVSYCEAGKSIGIEAGFMDSANEDLSSPLVLRLGNVEKDIGGCVEITISGGFQGISNVEEIKACGSRVYKIDDNLDGYNAPQITPQFDDSEPNTEEDVSSVRKG